MAAAPVPFVCPQCRGALAPSPQGYSCPACPRDYPLRFGFPDFRLDSFLTAVPDVDFDDDLESARILAEQEPHLTFAELMELHFRRRPAVSAAAQAAQLAHFEAEREQGAFALRQLARTPAGHYLDLGCGMGRYLVVAADFFPGIVGVDAALFQLVLARKHLAEAGVRAQLVAAQVERTPFPSAAFQAITATDLIEHLADPAACVRETARLLGPSGRLFVTAPNRFSLTPEPHVGVWGLGFLPRSWAEKLVQEKFGVDYRHIRPPSLARLRALLAEFPGQTRIETPAPGPAELATFSPPKRAAARIYLALRAVPGIRLLLSTIAPYFQGWAQKSD